MSFLFKSKKNAPPSASTLPAAARNLHTSDGTTTVNTTISEKPDSRNGPSPSSVINPNASLNSVTSTPGQQVGPQGGRRDRSESEAGVSRSANLMQQVPHAALYPWSQRSLNFRTPQSNPFPRYGAAVNAVASKEGDIYLMGGLINGSMVRGDLWMVEASNGNLTCSPIATVSEGPGPRVGHASLLVGNAFIVFGGDTKMDDSDVLDDTLYLLNTSSRQWSRASPPGPKPSGRYGHTLNILGSKIYIFGGQVEGAFYNDLIAFDLNALQNPANQWEFLIANTGDQEKPTVPPARTNHTVISHNDQLYLFGGTNGVQWFNDVWTYDPRVNLWTQLDCIGYIPAPREGHAAALVNDVMYVFGGRTEEGNDLGDLAAFRISLRRWYTFQNMGPSPSPRSGHSMTAFGKQIVVLAGEPSTAPRDAAELSLAYLLDTSKIRYPNDASGISQTQKAINGPPSPTRRPSSEAKHAIAMRASSREGQNIPGGHPMRTEIVSRDVMGGGPVQRIEPRNEAPIVSGPTILTPASAPSSAPTSPLITGPGPGSGPPTDFLSGPTNTSPPPTRIPRGSISQTSAGPPPQAQAPDPRVNGMIPSIASVANQQSRPTMQSPSAESARTFPVEVPPPPVQNPTIREVQRETTQPTRDVSPSSQGRRTPNHTSQGSVSKAKAMEAGEAAPLMSPSVARQRSLRSQRAHSSVDSSEDGVLGRQSTGKRRSDTPSERNSRSFLEEPMSPKVSPHQEALIKELEAVKSRNTWYASELALARKAGYATAHSPSMEDRTPSQFSDDDRPLVEAFMSMRAELQKMQQNMDQQASFTAKKIAEVEHQRDAAITEAAYARAKLAAHGGSQRSTPQLDGPRGSEESERSTEISRRLALALAATNEHKAKIDHLNEQLNAEKRARSLAEDTAEATHRRMEEVGQGQNQGELEAMRAELHEAQSAARTEAGQRVEAEQKLKSLEIDHTDLSERHRDMSDEVQDHASTLAMLEAAVNASTSKVGVYERQLGEERQQRDTLEQELSQLRREHDMRTQELETTSRHLRDVESLADSHAKEATTHREALVAGLAKISNPDRNMSRDSLAERKLAASQESADRAHALAKQNQEAAEIAAQKLRGAEERIAGLEAYQEQSSREGLQIRRQLQAALRDVQAHQGENRDLVSQLESHQRNTSALSVQHGALKDLLGERGIDMSNPRRSPGFESPASPDQFRLRELQQQLESSVRAHEDTRAMMETNQQETERSFREKLEQLENDYQSLLTYVKGTEKMLKKMKEELTKYKSQNQRLTTELDANKENKRSMDGMTEDAAAWHSERDALQSSIDHIKSSMSTQIQTLENSMAVIQRELATAQTERDQQMDGHRRLTLAAQQKENDLAQLKSENMHLETRALDAEHRVTMLLDQVGQSIGDMRRRSQVPPQHLVQAAVNGQHQNHNAIQGHDRGRSISTVTDTSSHADEEEDVDPRGSIALDHLANELETLRSQWENTSRSYRLSDRFDFEKTPTAEKPPQGELSDSLAHWRKRLDDDEDDDGAPGSSSVGSSHGAVTTAHRN